MVTTSSREKHARRLPAARDSNIGEERSPAKPADYEAEGAGGAVGLREFHLDARQLDDVLVVQRVGG